MSKSNKFYIFHGGCLECGAQFEEGFEFNEVCTNCRYFDADWNKPNRSIETDILWQDRGCESATDLEIDELRNALGYPSEYLTYDEDGEGVEENDETF